PLHWRCLSNVALPPSAKVALRGLLVGVALDEFDERSIVRAILQEQAPDPAKAGAAEQPQLAKARPAAQVSEHAFRLATFQPSRLGHTLSPSELPQRAG